MAWQNARVVINHEGENLIGISVEWTDLTEFATKVFSYQEDRIDRTNAAQRNAFRNRAENAREVERTKRQKIASFEASVLAFMNV